MKVFPHGIGRETQTVTYDTVKEHIVQYVQKTYKNGQDVAVSLRDLQKKDLSLSSPTRGQSQDTDQDANTKDQAGMAIMYQAELEQNSDRKETLEQNLKQASAVT